jgi:crossover junction endodeoxyribonuclease RuvC
MLIIGIDPGISGAIACMEDYKIIARVKWVKDMPTIPKSTGKGLQVDAHALASMMCGIGECRVQIEAVSAMPGQGVTSMFSFGKSAGIIEGVLAAYEIPYSFVRPQAWKKKFGLTGKDKDASRGLCLREHPEVADRLTRKKDNGRADAILIARYGEQ